MRIVAGKYRHRQLIYPDDVTHIRPTKDRIREALFSSLGDLTNIEVLDLYAGSGAMGIEALSRNASHATFVDNNKIAYKTVKANLDNLKIENATLLFKDDKDALVDFINQNKKFDLIILDPPYKLGDYIGIINMIIDSNLINADARVVTECDHELDFTNIPYKKIKTYHYSEIMINVLYF